MISKNTIKQIRSLEQRKFRKIEGKFIAEGNKLVEDNLSSMRCHRLIATADWFAAHPSAHNKAEEAIVVSHEELEKVSLLQTPQDVLGVFYIPQPQDCDLCYKSETPLAAANEQSTFDFQHLSLALALDSIQDPGNLGTIIRLCDWFGIKDIFCSETTADCYNPKVVQATMGAIARVRVHYLSLPTFLREARDNGIEIYGTFLEGDNIYSTSLNNKGIIVMGNEGNGISQEVAEVVTKKIHIPPYPADAITSESLNVGIATAITVAEFRRQSFNQ